VDVCGLEQPVGRAAALKPDELVERGAARQPSAYVLRHPSVEALARIRPGGRAFALIGAELPAHAAPLVRVPAVPSRSAATSAARLAAHFVMSPAPRQT